MAFAELGGVRIHYELSGREGAPVLVFSNSLGTDLTMWDAQVAETAKTFRVLRYDKRGHGQSSVPAGPYSIEQLGRDVLGLLDFLRLDKVDFCGLSIGGQTGMWFGVNAPERLRKLMLCSTAARLGTPQIWNPRLEAVREGGTKALAETVMERWFTADFRAMAPNEVARIRRVLENTDADGYIGCGTAVRDFDYRERLGEIRVATLVISGAQDPAAPAPDGRWAAEQILGARYVELDAAHLLNIELAEQFTAEITEFLAA
jgi:3-oxoadipate enol-lactonase